jgi:NADH-quinone oxidoreductase subunit M
MSLETVLGAIAILVPVTTGVGGLLSPTTSSGRRSSIVAAAVSVVALVFAAASAEAGRIAGADQALVARLTLPTVGPMLAVGAWNAVPAAAIALVALATMFATPPAKQGRVSFPAIAATTGCVIGALLAGGAWWFAGFVIAAGLSGVFELHRRGRGAGAAIVEMILFAGLLTTGVALADAASPIGPGLIVLAGLLRSGGIPFHLFGHHLIGRSSFGFGLVNTATLLGPIVVLRGTSADLPDPWLRVMIAWAFVSGLYAAAMVVVQTDARRALVFLSVWMACVIDVAILEGTTLGRSAALTLLVGGTLGLGGLGLALRSVEVRLGRLSLASYHGLHDHMPVAAVLCLVSGLALIGFPGLAGFAGVELLIESALDLGPAAAVALVLSMALAGVAVLRIHLRLFTGTRHRTGIDISTRGGERFGFLVVLVPLIVAGPTAQFYLDAIRLPGESTDASETTTLPDPQRDPASSSIQRAPASWRAVRDSEPVERDADSGVVGPIAQEQS